MEETVKALFAMHNNSRAIDAIHAIKPKNPNQLGIDIAIDEWGPAVITRINKIRSKLDPASSAGHAKIEQVLQKIESTYLRPGYQDVLRTLTPRDKIVLSHNDCQENNILSSLEDATRLTLIDYEYGNWNPQAYDLACYLNEMVCDNAHPHGCGVKHYMRNFPSNAEIERMTAWYAALEAQR